MTAEWTLDGAPTDGPARRGNLAYLCLQVTREGQASHAHVHEIIAGLREAGWRVTLFEPTGRGGKLWQFLGIQFRLLWRIQEFNAVYLRFHFAALPAAAGTRLFRRPVVQEVNGPVEDVFIAYPWTRHLAFLFRWLSRWSLRASTLLIAVTPQLREVLTRQFPRIPVVVIPNGANTDRFRPDAPVHESLPERFVVFFGALAGWQGIDDLLDAVTEADWPKDIDLVVVGDGAEQSRVAAAARSQASIHYLGTRPYDALPGIVRSSLGGIVPKNGLGARAVTGLFPLKLFETLACGVPVVVTDFPGQADLVRQWRCGLVIPPSDPAQIARAVAHLVGDEAARQAMGRRGRDAIVACHSWRRRAQDTDAAIGGALARD